MPVRPSFLLILAYTFILGGHPAKAGDPPPGGDSPLRRRAFAGIGFRAIAPSETDSLHLKGGLIVTVTVPGSPAAKVGLRVGDVIQSIDGKPVTDDPGLRAALRQHYAGDEISITVVSGGVEKTLRFAAAGAPEEQADSVMTEYTSFVSNGVRLRAVVTSPLGSEGKPRPALLIVSGLGSPQLIGGSFHSSMRTLARRAARAGFRVLRFELRGAGDSEGEDYHTTDFETEVGDNAAAYDYLASRPDVDPKRVFIYGHSTGGMEAAVAAVRRHPAGLITSCTVGRTFLERMADTIRLQREMDGSPPAIIDGAVNRYLEFATAMMRGAGASQLRADSSFAPFFNAAGRIMDDRTVEFWRQQLVLPLGETYSQITCPVLVVWAGSDFLTQRACHERIRDVLKAAGNKDVTLEVIPGTDHAYSHAKDARESWEHYRTGDFQENPAPFTTIVDWLGAH